MEEPPVDQKVRIITIICMTALIFTALVGITLTAILTDRNVHYAEGLSFGGALIVALMGGFTMRQLHRRRRWRIEREDNGESNGS